MRMIGHRQPAFVPKVAYPYQDPIYSCSVPDKAAILGILALGAGFGLMLAEVKLRKLQYDIEEEELNKKETVRQAEEIIEQLNENVWEKYE